MERDLELILRGLGGQVACLILKPGQDGPPQKLLELNPDLALPAASLIKVPILFALASQLEQPGSAYTWETRLSVPAEAHASSAGVLADLSPDLRPTLQDIAYLMITLSDNTAANMLLDLLGMETINAFIQSLGLLQTRLERRFMDFEARQAGRENWTSAADMARLFALLWQADFPQRQRLLKILWRQNDNGILPAYWNEELPFAHKTGGLPGIMHDAGLVFRTPEDSSPLLIVTMTAEQKDLPFTQLTLARLGRAIRERWL